MTVNDALIEKALKPTVFVVDNDFVLQEVVADMVTAMGLNVECYSIAQKFLDAYSPMLPGCLVVELRLPGMSGIKLQQKLNVSGMQLPVIMLTSHGDLATGVRAMKQGAIDFLEKPYQPKRLRECIRQAIELDTRRRQEQAWKVVMSTQLALLTPDEQKVANMFAGGYSNKQIAFKRGISLRTVQFRRANIMKKLNLKSRAALVQFMVSVSKPL